jgi:hypothetical protein
VKNNSSSDGAYRGIKNYPTGYPAILTIVIHAIGVSKVIDDRRVGIGMDSDNVLNDEEILVYDTLIGGFKGVAVDDTPVNGETTVPISSNWAYDHVAAADPHEGYRLETADHTHATTGAEAGQLDHGAAMEATSLLDDDHTQYVLAAGDTLTGQMILSGSGITYFKERPRIELSRVLSVSKPSIVFRGTIRGFSLPIYASDNEELFFDLPSVPARWDGASDPIVYVTGYLDTANTSKKFKLACDWTYFSADDEPDGVAVESPSVETTTATWGQYHTFTAAITLNYDVVSANALAVGDFLQLRVYRIAASGNEIAGEVVVTGIAIKWRMDKLYSSS